MWLRKLFDTVKSCRSRTSVQNVRREQPRSRSANCRLGVEALEDRCVPASLSIGDATVLEGAIRSKVNDGPEKVYRAGENWSEQPGDHHLVSANASDTEPAKLLAVFVVDTNETSIVIDDAQ